MILIFSNKEDSHPTNVIKYLNAWGVPVFRLNTECLLTDYEFSWWCNNDSAADFHIKNKKAKHEVFGHEITAIWDRRALKPQTLPVTHKERSINKYNRDEALGFLSFLRYYLRDIFSIGSIVEDRPADSKMLQLAIARELGMQIPDTCFANNKEAFSGLFSRHESISLKPILSDSLFLGEDKEYVFYAQKAASAAITQQSAIAFQQTANFLQNYVEKQYEIRVTVCCNDMVACKIDSQQQSDATGKIDWRQGYDHQLKHERIDLPDQIKQFCLKFLEKMHLNFGCFDFIVTPDNEYVFLECNPNGQWLWIELETGADISLIIARNLSKYEQPKNSPIAITAKIQDTACRPQVAGNK